MAIKSIKDVSGVVYRQPPEYHPRSSAPHRAYHSSPVVWEDQVLYFILPDRFSDSSETSENLYIGSDNANAIDTLEHAKDWRDAGKNWCGGTLKGLRQQLDYLNELGVTTLWVGPIFRQVKDSDTYHGYGVQNFFEVDTTHFGSKDDLKALIEAAHSKDMYVILDIILNHSGDVFAYEQHEPEYNGNPFNVKGFYDNQHEPRLAMEPVDDSQYPDGAVWPQELQHGECFTRKGKIVHWDEKPEYLDGDFYALKDIALGSYEPDNFNAPVALKALCEVYKYWIAEADIDGYRIDTVKHMGDGPTRYFTNVIHEYAQSLGKDKFLIIGEIAAVGGDKEPYKAYRTVERTGLDAALGINNIQEMLWKTPSGDVKPEQYFDLFRNALYIDKGSHKWIGEKVVTMLDDHDQIWRDEKIGKARFCSQPGNSNLVAAALMLNLCTLGIPCIYYGTEQAFDGAGLKGDEFFEDRYIREAMFGGKFGAFRSKDRHFFNKNHSVYKDVQQVIQIRKDQIALRRGRQYLRETSGDGINFGYPYSMGGSRRILGIIAWSRLFAEEEVLCAFNTDPNDAQKAWVTVDKDIHPSHTSFGYLTYRRGGTVSVESKGARSAVFLELAAGEFVILK